MVRCMLASRRCGTATARRRFVVSVPTGRMTGTAMNIFKVLPDLAKSKHLALFHHAARGQWGADEIAWDRPPRIGRAHLRRQLARVLTPILMGEQSAFHSLSTIIPILGREMEVESQMFLTSMAMDEARHTELFARVYHRLGEEPISLRRFPSGYLFQSAILSEDPGEWIVGSLVSEVLAKRVLEELRDLDLDPVLSELCGRVLVDEARHLAFNHAFLSDRLGHLLGQQADSGQVASSGQDRMAALRSRQEGVLAHVPAMFEALEVELKDCGFDTAAVLHDVFEQARRRLERSFDAARRLLPALPRAAAGP